MEESASRWVVSSNCCFVTRRPSTVSWFMLLTNSSVYSAAARGSTYRRRSAFRFPAMSKEYLGTNLILMPHKTTPKVPSGFESRGGGRHS